MCTNMGKGRSGKSDTGSLKNGFNGKWFGVSVLNNGGKRTDYYFKQEKSSVLMRVGLSGPVKKHPLHRRNLSKTQKERPGVLKLYRQRKQVSVSLRGIKSVQIIRIMSLGQELLGEIKMVGKLRETAGWPEELQKEKGEFKKEVL